MGQRGISLLYSHDIYLKALAETIHTRSFVPSK